LIFIYRPIKKKGGTAAGIPRLQGEGLTGSAQGAQKEQVRVDFNFFFHSPLDPGLSHPPTSGADWLPSVLSFVHHHSFTIISRESNDIIVVWPAALGWMV
jgi:hypothetical protein